MASLREQRLKNGVVQTLDSIGGQTRVAIDADAHDPSKYYISVPIGDEASGHREHGVYVKIAVKPENPALWRRATESQIQSQLSRDRDGGIAAAAQAQDPVAGLFGDLFRDYHSRTATKSYALRNDPESRKHYELQALGSFAPLDKVVEACWQFPSVPKTALNIDYLPIEDRTARPVYVKGPPDHLWPSDFGRGITQYWRQHPSGDHSKDVYVVSKLEIPGWVPERPKYLGVMWQVPDWMIRRFGPMGVKSIDLQKDEVEYYVDNEKTSKGATTLAATISEARDRRSLPDANLEESRRQQRLALLDLQEDYPVFLKNLLEDEEVAATRKYMDRIEQEDAKERSAQITAQKGVPAEDAANERVNSELFSRESWKQRVELVQKNRTAKDPRQYPMSYSGGK